MNRTITAATIAGTVAVLTAAPALAGVAYMDGLFNVGPGWSTITGPNGEKCGAGCTEVRYDYISGPSATRAAGKWMDANNTPDSILFAYSLATDGTTDARAARPDWQGTIINLGSPAHPENGRTAANGGRPVLDVAGGRVEYIKATGDGVTEKSGGVDAEHLNGYRGHNYQTETALSSVTYNGNVRAQEFSPTKPATAAPAKLTWAERSAIAKAERAERAEARKVARAERREASRARWTAFVDRITKKPAAAAADVDEDQDASASSAPADKRDSDSDASE